LEAVLKDSRFRLNRDTSKDTATTEEIVEDVLKKFEKEIEQTGPVKYSKTISCLAWIWERKNHTSKWLSYEEYVETISEDDAIELLDDMLKKWDEANKDEEQEERVPLELDTSSGLESP